MLDNAIELYVNLHDFITKIEVNDVLLYTTAWSVCGGHTAYIALEEHHYDHYITV